MAVRIPGHERLRRLTLFVRGWMNYYGISEYYRPIPEIDKWIRRRVRMSYWKQWRRPRTKIRNLLALGSSRRQARSKHPVPDELQHDRYAE